MRNDEHKSQGATGRANGFIPNSFRAFSSYLRIVSSGASSVASTVKSAASSIVDRDGDANFDQVLWAGFDKLERGREVIRQVLLLGYRYGFQVWDVEEAHNVHNLVSRHDGPVSFLQMLPNPLTTMARRDEFSDNRPLLALCTSGSHLQDGTNATCNGGNPKLYDFGNGYRAPSTVQFYSLSCQSYVHVLKFRSVVYSVRCSHRVVAVSQAAQVHCFNAATLEREYTVLTNPVATGGPGSGGLTCGALALGPRWLAYSGTLVHVSNEVRICPQHLTPSTTFPSTAATSAFVAEYAKESSKHLISGLATLGDIGYKKMSRYCSELLPNSNHSLQSVAVGQKANGAISGNLCVGDNVGMVIVKDVVSKAVITQFRAHKSPISALSFDPSGTLLATVSVHGHNVNVFHIIPEHPGYVHLYKLQRGLTEAIIQDITFSGDSRWIMISSSRGTSHLFAISPFGGTPDPFESNALNVMNNPAVRWKSKLADQCPLASGTPVTLSAVSRIRNGNKGWRGSVNGGAAAAMGKSNFISGAIATTFLICKDDDMHVGTCNLRCKYHLLIFSPSGCLIEYALRVAIGLDTAAAASHVYESSPGNDPKLMVAAIKKWNINQKQRGEVDNFDIYGENVSLDTYRLFQGTSKNGYVIHPVVECTTSGSQMSPKERNRFFLSETELQMHGQQIPLWARPEVCFLWMTDDLELHNQHAGGEIEIEKIHTHMIEAKPKNLIPVYYSLDYTNSQLPSVAASHSKLGLQQLPQVSGLSPNGNCSFGSGYNAFGLVVENDPSKLPDTIKGSVNTNDSLNKVPQAQFVNNTDRECLKMDAHLKLVNKGEALKMENHFEDESEAFD